MFIQNLKTLSKKLFNNNDMYDREVIFKSQINLYDEGSLTNPIPTIIEGIIISGNNNGFINTCVPLKISYKIDKEIEKSAIVTSNKLINYVFITRLDYPYNNPNIIDHMQRSLEIFIKSNHEDEINILILDDMYAYLPHTVEKEIFVNFPKFLNISDRYKISNYGNIKDIEFGEMIPVSYFHDGPRILLTRTDFSYDYYSISKLMNDVFNPEYTSLANISIKEYGTNCAIMQDVFYSNHFSRRVRFDKGPTDEFYIKINS